MGVLSVEWLEYLGRDGSLEELVVKNCKGVSQYDLLKFGSGWMLQKFEFEINDNYRQSGTMDRSYMPHYPYVYNTLTPSIDDSLKALALYCPILQTVELKFTFCSSMWPSEIGFTQEGIVTLIQLCPIRVFVLNGAHIFEDKGMKGLSSAQFLETLELVHCEGITDAGMSFIVHTPPLINLTLRKCKNVTDDGMAELAPLPHNQRKELKVDTRSRYEFYGGLHALGVTGDRAVPQQTSWLARCRRSVPQWYSAIKPLAMIKCVDACARHVEILETSFLVRHRGAVYRGVMPLSCRHVAIVGEGNGQRGHHATDEENHGSTTVNHRGLSCPDPEGSGSGGLGPLLASPSFGLLATGSGAVGPPNLSGPYGFSKGRKHLRPPDKGAGYRSGTKEAVGHHSAQGLP
uniref:Uncharacterized protein n=1 Tax=Leersia perrieri TaxID=77586 RepID=A0A0D9WEN2_9ORYZ